jgi:hypothetical protein
MLACVEGDIAAQPDFDAIGPGLDRECRSLAPIARTRRHNGCASPA